MSRQVKAALTLALSLCLAGCDSSPPKQTEHSQQRSTASSSADAPSPPNTRQLAAEQVQHTLSPQIESLARTYGEGTNSPCSSAAAELFTPSCAAMADAVGKLAQNALAEIQGKSVPFTTMRRVAMSARNAAEQYPKLSCGTLPSSASVQEACRKHGAVIAQSPVDFRDGVNMGLAGK
ncbi:hypothetical protein [Streptomyces albipurpureus]|uniref:Lipoprotein n=1 Tax=Streptomyces albipurpureus TaxID=2897419 RepID=A0ABT0UZB7_9ACTN|nr:hypothetical protein [Streptomyces sp. CWNU-1]MCM2393912.1 hypothetical protein [Streptomyces sp. CWNU-1]